MSAQNNRRQLQIHRHAAGAQGSNECINHPSHLCLSPCYCSLSPLCAERRRLLVWVTLREKRQTPSARLHLRVLSLSPSPFFPQQRKRTRTSCSSPLFRDQNLSSPFPSGQAQAWVGGTELHGKDAVSLESVSRLFTSTIGARCLLSLIPRRSQMRHVS